LKLLAAVCDDVEEFSRLAVDELDVGRA